MTTATRPLSYESLNAKLQSNLIQKLGYTDKKATEDAAKYASIFCEVYSK